METQNENLNENQKRARRLLAKARYLATIAGDKDVDELVRKDIGKAVFYLYRCAFYINGSSEQEVTSQLLNEAARQAGI